MTNGVEVRDVAKSFGTTAVLDGVSASVGAGRLTGLLGPSGSGKTTLLRIVAGFVAPDRGIVRIAGEDVTAVPVWRRRIGMVFQSYALFPHMSVAENVAYGLARRGIGGAEARRRVGAALDTVRLPGFEARRPKQLSGGQQQRVALARAIVIEPAVLLLDEPLSALDRRLRGEMQVELRRIQRDTGLTTIFVTHDQDEALALSDRVAILDRGRIVQEGAPADVYERPRTRFAAGFLGAANLLAGRATPGGVALDGVLIRTDEPLPAAGARVTVAMRPEKIDILPGDDAIAAGRNRASARLLATTYAGAASTHTFDAGPLGTLRVFAHNRGAPALEPGATVTLAWAPAHTIVLED